MNIIGLLNAKYMIPIGDGGITYYGFFIAMAILLGAVLGYFVAKRRKLHSDTVIDMVIWAIPLAIVGARAYYVIFDALDPNGNSYNSFLDVIAIWEGGLAIYGGVLGAILGVFILSRINKRKPGRATFYQMADVGAPFLILGQAIGRWGNYVNQEAYGVQITNPNWFNTPFAVWIDSEGAYHLACYFIESMWCLIGFAILMFFVFRKKEMFSGFNFAFYMIFYGIGRIVIEGFRTDSLYVFRVIRVSQLVSGILALWGVVMIAAELLKRGSYKEGGTLQKMHNWLLKRDSNWVDVREVNKLIVGGMKPTEAWEKLRPVTVAAAADGGGDAPSGDAENEPPESGDSEK